MSRGDKTRELTAYNRTRLRPGEANDLPPSGEEEYLGEALERVRPLLPRKVTVDWWEGLLHTGPGQGDPLFPFLAQKADRCQLRWFLVQEAAGEAGFDDLVALTQVKMPPRVKLELARNYWDEMGRGDARGTHGGLLQDTLAYFQIGEEDEAERLDEPAELANLMLAMAARRRHAFRALGAMGAVEMTAPGRVALVDRGLRRLGVPDRYRRYFALHATLDLSHSAAWNREVLRPLAADHLREMAEGALVRLDAGRRCFEAYRKALGVTETTRGPVLPVWEHPGPVSE